MEFRQPIQARDKFFTPFAPSRPWRDYVSEDGELPPAARERLEREDTGVQRGRAVG